MDAHQWRDVIRICGIWSDGGIQTECRGGLACGDAVGTYSIDRGGMHKD